jgi:probable phosphoglycerate mutase
MPRIQQAPDTKPNAVAFAFMRHGTTEHNLRGLRCGGDLDVPLTDVGCHMVFEMACAMQQRSMGWDVILCGTLQRTRQSALIVSGVLGALPIISMPALDERHLGQWNGQPIKDTEALLANNQAPPGGEPEDVFVARVSQALSEIEHHRSQRTLVVSSKGVGRVLNSLLGGTGRLTVSNGELVVFTPRPDGGVELSRPLIFS